MELDDLRRRWQEQPAEHSSLLSPEAMQLTVARSSSSPVAKMRRNTWLELIISLVLISLCIGTMMRTRNVHAVAMAVWIAVLGLGGLIGFRHQLRLLHPLSERSHNLRQQLEQQISSLREFMAHAYKSAVRTIPVSFGIDLVIYTIQDLHTYHGWLLVGMLGFLYVLYAVVIWAACRFMPIVFRELQQ